MNDKLFKDIKTSKQVTIIGVSVVASNEYRTELEQALFSDLQEGKKKCVVIAESDNQLFQQSLLTDTDNGIKRMSFKDLTIMREFFLNKFSRTQAIEEKPEVRISSLMLPFYVIKTDENLWHLSISDFNADNYFLLKKGDNLYNSVTNYIDLLNGDLSQFLSKPDDELLELFDQYKVPRGIFPRNSFYNTDHYQYVVWGLVFNREGRLLIHQRSINAKDNQGMWDKSVGGHLDFTKEKSTQDGMIRELIEELYTKEKKEQSGHVFSMLTDDKSSVYFLGDWRLKDCGYEPYYLDHIKLLENKKDKGEENWVIYKYPEAFTHNTPRELPDGTIRRLRVVVDVFFIITNTDVKDDYIKNLANSKFLLIEPNKLKSWMDNGIADDDMYNVDKKDKDNNIIGREFKVTPDLNYIMTGKLRDIINEVSTTIKYSNIRK